MPSNLPPGVSDWMIPGNRPEDEAWDDLYGWMAGKDIDPQEVKWAVESYLLTRNRVLDERKSRRAGHK